MFYIKIREIVFKNRYINIGISKAWKEPTKAIRAIFAILVIIGIILVIVILML